MKKRKECDNYGMGIIAAVIGVATALMLIGVVSSVINHHACVDTQASMACSDMNGARY